MALIYEILANIIPPVSWPFSLFKLASLFGFRTTYVVICTLVELARAVISSHVNMIWGIITWTIGLVSLPVRVANAFQRNKQLEHQLREMQSELEGLMWDHKELQKHLLRAVKERKIMALVLTDLEEKHDMAIAKTEQLEGKLRDVTNENLRLREILTKGYWNSKGLGDTSHSRTTIDRVSSLVALSHKSSYGESGIAFQDQPMHKDTWEDETKSKTELWRRVKSEIRSKPVASVRPEMIFKNVEAVEVLDQCRDVAISQSLFSAFLSLLVGVMVWKAEDPCIPLVLALFSVVGMSLKSVVQFFSTIKNKPASDAVALLSFNWFILGTLTYPTLPRVARMLTPLLFKFPGPNNEPASLTLLLFSVVMLYHMLYNLK